MGISKTEYVTTSRELLEKLAAETVSEGISSIAKGNLNEYSDWIEELEVRLASELPAEEKAVEAIRKEESYQAEQFKSPIAVSSGLRRRLTLTGSELEADGLINAKVRNVGQPLRLDAASQDNIEKHRNLQEDLTDEIVELAHQLKDSSLMMNQSVQAAYKLDFHFWMLLCNLPFFFSWI
uniref:Uncharacterized protein n=1 Tax=Leersia perrieri TaxID=77586 RepID=A0A0D9XBV4_9ORYZ